MLGWAAGRGPAGGGVTWVLAERPQGAETCVGQSPELVLLEGPAQLGQEVLQGDILGVGESHSGCRHLGGGYRARTTSNTVGVPPPPMTGWGVPTSAQQVWGCEWRVQTPVHGQQKHKMCNSVEKLHGGPSEKQTRNYHLLWQSHLKAGS